jgi:hypothetical protein
MAKSLDKPKKQITRNKTKYKSLATNKNNQKNRNNNNPTKNRSHPPHSWTPYEKPSTNGMPLVRNDPHC